MMKIVESVKLKVGVFLSSWFKGQMWFEYWLVVKS
jgi:hypothetical protein